MGIPMVLKMKAVSTGASNISIACAASPASSCCRLASLRTLEPEEGSGTDRHCDFALPRGTESLLVHLHGRPEVNLPPFLAGTKGHDCTSFHTALSLGAHTEGSSK